jgi:hypothetical protein
MPGDRIADIAATTQADSCARNSGTDRKQRFAKPSINPASNTPVRWVFRQERSERISFKTRQACVSPLTLEDTTAAMN